MPLINLFGVGQQGRSINVSAQKRLNCFIEVTQTPDKCQAALYGTPGLTLLSAASGGPSRGVWWAQAANTMYTVHGSTLYAMATDGTVTSIGTLSTTAGNVRMVDNGFQLLIVDGAYGYLYTFATGVFARITAGGFPNGCQTCCFIDSYFVVNRPNTAQFFISGQYDGATWNALNFATAEAKPDSLIAVDEQGGNLVLFGETSIEFWGDSGAVAFPFARISGATQEGGLAARYSIARCAGSPFFLGRTRRGGLQIARLNGYQYEVVSTPELEWQLSQYSTVADAVAFSYIQAGHDFYQLTLPTVGVTYLYDAASNAWSQLASAGTTRHLAQFATMFGNRIIATDYANGNIYYIDPTNYTDNGQTIVREVISPHKFDPDARNMVSCQRIRVEFEQGIGLRTGQGSSPQIMLQLSRDGGNSYGRELWVNLATMGDYTHYAEWRRLGIARDWVVKLRLTDPVKFVMTNAFADYEALNK